MIEDAIANAGPRSRASFATMCEVAQRFAGWLDLGIEHPGSARVRLRALGRAGIPGCPRRRDPAADASPARGAGTSPSSSPRRAPTRHGPSSSAERVPRTSLGSPSSPCGTSTTCSTVWTRRGCGSRRSRPSRSRRSGSRAIESTPPSRPSPRSPVSSHRGCASTRRAWPSSPRPQPGGWASRPTPSPSCAAPRSHTTSAASACRTRSGRSRARSDSASGSGCDSILTSPSAPSPSRRRSLRSGSWPARTTNGSTAPATTAAHAARHSTNPPASSPPPTATRPCARRGRTGRLSTRRRQRRN